jgi:hypothetical protein
VDGCLKNGREICVVGGQEQPGWDERWPTVPLNGGTISRGRRACVTEADASIVGDLRYARGNRGGTFRREVARCAACGAH